jgi:3-hydroxyisobutyrate dehydrogenase and related beta-hydroxyacid dehydrogenases
MRTGFIGLGQMGAGMAARLHQAGYDLTVFNRSAERMQPLLAMGAKGAKTSLKSAMQRWFSPCSPTTKRSRKRCWAPQAY